LAALASLARPPMSLQVQPWPAFPERPESRPVALAVAVAEGAA
jgi:hypothetical protein